MAFSSMKASGRRAGKRPTPGFSLLEMLLVLGLMTLLAGLFVVATKTWISGTSTSNAQVLQDAVHAARASAVVSDSPVLLRVEADGRGLALDAGSRSHAFKLTGEVVVRFMQSRFGGQGENRVVVLSVEMTKGVRFYSDGTCDAFVAVLRAGSGEDQVMAVDPWNCATQPLAARDA